MGKRKHEIDEEEQEFLNEVKRKYGKDWRKKVRTRLGLYLGLMEARR